MEQKIINTSKIITITSFSLGTILFLIFLNFEENETLIFCGLWYTLTAIFVNFIFSLTIAVLGIILKLSKIEILKSFGILSLNIPITIFYIYIVFSILIEGKNY